MKYSISAHSPQQLEFQYQTFQSSFFIYVYTEVFKLYQVLVCCRQLAERMLSMSFHKKIHTKWLIRHKCACSILVYSDLLNKLITSKNKLTFSLISGVCTNSTAPSVSSINRILRNRAAERAAAEFARAAGCYAGLYHPYAFPWPGAAAAAQLWSPMGGAGGVGGGVGQPGGQGTVASAGAAGAHLPHHHPHAAALASLSASAAAAGGTLGGTHPPPSSSDLSHPGSHSTSSTRPSSSESPTIREKHGKQLSLKHDQLPRNV